ncbi:hypothetical protein ZWY2020_034859 [Hordeum vulgare]|nr:hypothetical protein ZWY2020_034859 [Hordeum vulgare]
MAAATAPATAPKLAAEVYTAELAGLPLGARVGAPSGVAETEEGVIAEGASVGASVVGAGGEAIGDGDAAVGGVATGDLAGGAGSGAILGAGMGPCAAAATARSATMAATTAKRAICLLSVVQALPEAWRGGGDDGKRMLRICV